MGRTVFVIDRPCMLSRRNERHLRRYLFLVVSALIVNFILPTPTHAASAAETETQNVELVSLTPEITTVQFPVELLTLPTVASKLQPVVTASEVSELKQEGLDTRFVRTSAYSSTPDQTDSSPFITASGTTVHDGTIATNCLPIGTKIRIPEYFGDKIFTVEDRMSSRWGCGKIDIWMPSREAAMAWGIPKVQIEIL